MSAGIDRRRNNFNLVRLLLAAIVMVYHWAVLIQSASLGMIARQMSYFVLGGLTAMKSGLSTQLWKIVAVSAALFFLVQNAMVRTFR